MNYPCRFELRRIFFLDAGDFLFECFGEFLGEKFFFLPSSNFLERLSERLSFSSKRRVLTGLPHTFAPYIMSITSSAVAEGTATME